MIKLLAIKPCFMQETGKSAITVGKFYFGTYSNEDPYTYHIVNDFGDNLKIESRYLKEVGYMQFKDFYREYAGKCKELAEALVAEYPDQLTLVRGHVIFSSKLQEQHWWTKDNSGNIHDPSRLQFTGEFTYEEFSGVCICANCGADVLEEDAIFMSRYPTCSSKCARELVGI